MTSDRGDVFSDSAAISPLPPDPRPDLADIGPTPDGDFIRTGWRVAKNTWYAAAAMFVLSAPQAIGGAAIAMLVTRDEFRQLQTNPATAPRWPLIAMSIFGIGNCFWGVFALFAMPWVYAAAAARIRELLMFPERRNTSFVDAGNRVYARVLVLSLLKWLLVAVCGIPSIAAMLYFSHGGLYQSQNVETMQRMAFHPAVLSANVVAIMGRAAIAVGWLWSIAAIVVENQGIIGTIQRTADLIAQRPRDAGKLFLLAVLIMIPPFLVQELSAIFGFNWAFVTATAISVIYTAWTDLVLLGIVIAVYVARGPFVRLQTAPS